MPQTFVPIILGSKADLDHARAITTLLDTFDIPHETRIASAHKATRYLLDLLTEYESSGRALVYITVAGRSNALSGVVDANVTSPVIACPPPSSSFGGMDILSSLRMPSGLAALVVLEPEAAALAAAKILAHADPSLTDRIKKYQAKSLSKIQDDDASLR